ncbi:MAG: hypothetical protein BMS9Abin12_1981 [Acidimicrobiia bacterium]|nr:MAG: hypothetical protein BMS9Abin12_1981 [Acidimicrobiia bacterium]
MIKTAYFRTYLPAGRVGALPPAGEENGRLPVKHDGPFLWTESTADDALFTVWQGEQYACPRNTRIRMIEGVLAFTKTYPAMHLVAEIERLKLVAELSELRTATPLSRSYILSSPWHVPLRWFSAFAPSERELYETSEGPSIRYRTSIGEAVDRVHWSATVLANAGFPEQVIERVNDLERWLMEYSAESMVELDYDRVAQVFSAADIALDESVEDVRNSLLALERGDGETSQRHYETVASRWFHAQAFTFSN